MDKSLVERGQSVVILAIVIIGLLAVSALAVDGGAILTERRRAQTAADSAAMSAAYALLDSRNIVTAGKQQAAVNGFTDNGSDPLVEVYNPPVSGQYVGDSAYIQVRITSSLKPVFSHFIFGDSLKNTSEAVVKAVKGSPYAIGNALFATSDNSCDALYFSGSAQIEVQSGGVYSNSDNSYKNSNCYSGVVSGNKVSLLVVAGGITTHGVWYDTHSGAYAAAGVTQNAPRLDVPISDDPECDTSVSKSYTNQNSIDPGWYPNGISVTNKNVTLNPGLYCLGNSFTANGNGSITGIGVTIYMKSGDFNLGGGNLVHLEAPTELYDENGNSWAGMLVYVDVDNTGIVNINGNAATTYSGTILAPGPASPVTKTKCTVSGNSENFSFNSQLICYTITVIGNSPTNINYNVDDNYIVPGIITFMK